MCTEICYVEMIKTVKGFLMATLLGDAFWILYCQCVKNQWNQFYCEFSQISLIVIILISSLPRTWYTIMNVMITSSSQHLTQAGRATQEESQDHYLTHTHMHIKLFYMLQIYSSPWHDSDRKSVHVNNTKRCNSRSACHQNEYQTHSKPTNSLQWPH